MASVTRYKGGWRAHVYVRGVRDSKLLRTAREAYAWAAQREKELAGGVGGDMLFKDAAERFLKWKLPQLTNVDNQAVYEQSIRDHVLPVIGREPLRDLRRQKLVALVRGIAEAGKVETAHRVGQRIAAILDHCVDHGDIESHAAAGLSRVLPAKTKRKMPAIPAADLPALLRAIQGYPEPVTRIGLLLLAHTFVRTSELLGARWEEFKADTWVIPAERMKRRLTHVVPLSSTVLALLEELRSMTGDGEYLLASPFNPLVPISKNTLLFALYRLGYRGMMTGHGFRAVASTVLNESGLWNADAIERQLAHKEKDDVRESYLRAEFLEERRRMMEWYSTYLAERAAMTSS